MTNHKKLIDVTASLERNCLYLEKKRHSKNRSVCKNAVDIIGLVWELHAPTDRLLVQSQMTKLEFVYYELNLTALK